MKRWTAAGLLMLMLVPLIGSEGPVVLSETVEAVPKPSRFTWGGWLALLHRDGDDEAVQTYSGLPHMYLYGDFKFQSKWRLFAEVEHEEEPGLYGETHSELILERAFVEYRKSAALMFRLGRFNTRAGIQKPLHWDITLDEVRLPIMESNGYVPAKSTGLEILGSKILPKGAWRYAAALSTAGRDIENGEGIEEAKGGGLDLSYEGSNRFRIGGSFFYYLNPDEDEDSVRAYQPYLEYKPVQGKLLFRAEALILNKSYDEDIQAYYAKLKWDLGPRTYLNLRYDHGEDERDADGDLRVSQTLTFGFRPKNQWRFKMEYGHNDFPDVDRRSFSEWSLWMGYVFP